MAKIFHGGKVYEVSDGNEAMAVLYKLSHKVRGTFEGCFSGETGFYIDKDRRHSMGEGRYIYDIVGASDGKSYAETDDLNLFD